MTEKSTQLVVLGGGPGGYPAAFYAADLGMQVTLVDLQNTPGGVCLHRGCIPSKALLHVAAVLNEAREAPAFGVTFGEPQLDVDTLREWKNDVVKKLTGGLGMLGKQRKVEYIQGRGTFVDAHVLEIATDDETIRLTFEHAIIATGSEPARIPGFPDSPRVMDSTGALAVPDIPETLLVVGGGYIGLELGQAYAAFGSKVSVVEMLPSILAGADADLSRVPQQRFKKQFESIMVNTRVVAMKENGERIAVTLEPQGKEAETIEYDRVLVSVGRKPNSCDLGLENTAVRIGDGGFIETDAQRRTAEASIFAIGDVTGQPMLAHKATAEGKVAVEAIAGKKTVFDPRAIPAVVFTDPEVAWCGLTEAEATEQGIPVKVGRFPWAASGRATTLGRGDGVTKIIADPETERILGVGISGPGAGELIAEGTLAIEMGAVVGDLALTIHPHPTLSETVMEAAEAFHGTATHFAVRKK
ncbi:MAG: dihydrolipoyl dehydrogenase [Kiritimatiellae bacterium]|nr:dihydrolipoyl dehydrogenase [Kiritimatiellia bacterium]